MGKDYSRVVHIAKIWGIKKPKYTRYRDTKEWKEWFGYYRNLTFYKIREFIDAL